MHLYTLSEQFESLNSLELQSLHIIMKFPIWQLLGTNNISNLDVFAFIIWEDNDVFHLFQAPLNCHRLRILQDTKSLSR